MNTWLVFIDGRYLITYSIKKPDIEGKVIAKAGNMVYQFDPGYAENDLVYTKLISGFQISLDQKDYSYLLIDQNNRLETANKERVTVLGPLVNWLLYWLFCNFTFKSNLD